MMVVAILVTWDSNNAIFRDFEPMKKNKTKHPSKPTKVLGYNGDNLVGIIWMICSNPKKDKEEK